MDYYIYYYYCCFVPNTAGWILVSEALSPDGSLVQQVFQQGSCALVLNFYFIFPNFSFFKRI